MTSENIQKNRFISDFLPKSTERRLVILTGARQTGKTTLARFQYPELRYINLDAPENREVLRSVSSEAWKRDVGNAVIDEAQKEPAIFEKIKYAYDERTISFQLLLGSSQILLLKKVRESLSGRVSIYEIWPLMLSEIIQDVGEKDRLVYPLADRLFSNTDFNQIFEGVTSVLLSKEEEQSRQAENYLLNWGGMPALLPLSGEERWKWLKDYEYTYLERDLADLARLDDLEPFRKFQKLSALHSGNLLNYSEIARDAGVSVDTARRYLEYLRISYQVVLLSPYYQNVTASLVKTPKLYWIDIGILRQLSGYRGDYTGHIYETMVVGEFYKWIKTSQRYGELYFYRTRSGLEVDLILQTENGVVGVEIKSRQKLVNSDIRPLKIVAEQMKNKWRGGIVIYHGNQIKKISEPNIWAVPFRRLFS